MSRRWSVAPALIAAAILMAACGSPTTTSPSAAGGTTSAAPEKTPATKTPTTQTPTTQTTETTSSPPAATAWTTYHGDVARDGVDASAPPAGRLSATWTATVDGAVLAEPLVADGMVIVATEHDTAEALDSHTGVVRWSTHLGTPVNGSSLPCGDIDPSGITGTPVIDTSTSTVWVVDFVQGSAAPSHHLVGLDLATGAVRSTRVADVANSDPTVEQQRGALLLDGGSIYIPYGGLYGDCGPYHGSVMALPASGSGPGMSWVVPTAREGGIWSPGGPVLAADGRILVTTGNAASRSIYDDANAVVALSPQLAPVDLFAPANWEQLSADDQDLSSASAALLPSGLVVAAGKQGLAYLLDPGHLGGVGGQIAEVDACQGAGVYGGTAVSGSTVYLPCRNGLRAVDASGRTLRVEWHLGTAGPGAPVVAGGEVWVLHRDGTLLGVDPATGSVRQQLSLGAAGTPFPTLSASGAWLYAPVGDHVIGLSGA